MSVLFSGLARPLGSGGRHGRSAQGRNTGRYMVPLLYGRVEGCVGMCREECAGVLSLFLSHSTPMVKPWDVRRTNESS